MVEPQKALSQEEIDFQAKCEADAEAYRQFVGSISGPQERYNSANPYYRLAPEYFQIYLDKRPSNIAKQALDKAFSMWRGTKGTSQQVEDALEYLSFEEDLWESVGGGIVGAFSADKRWEDAQHLLESLVDQVVPWRSRSALLFELARRWAGPWPKEGELEKARSAFEQIIEWDADERRVEESRAYLYEINTLSVGQPAPHFAAKDIDGHLIDSRAYRGRIVLLDFWASWCKPCYPEFAHLRQAAEKYSSDQFSIISISLDRSVDDLRACMERERLIWTHIWAGSDRWNTPLARLFHISGIPKTYLIDQYGNIAAKNLYQVMIENEVKALL